MAGEAMTGSTAVEGAAVVRTFLFTDIEGSTRSWQSAPDGMAAALERHDAILRAAIARHGGAVVKHVGDGFLAVFAAPRAAAEAATDAQRALVDAVPFTVRMAISTGEARTRDGDWFGPAVNRAARLLDAGYGGQVLVSAASAALLRDLPIGEARLDDLGQHRLRDLPDPQAIYQLTASGLADRFPPLRTAVAIHTLPATRTPLVGRERELDELVALSSRARLLTITGVAGVGKTRLALELAGRTLPAHPGGTFFADLSSVTTSERVAPAVVQALGVESLALAASAPPEEQLVAFLAPRTALLVLDNCEHVLDECAELVDVLLDACPDLRLVTTSREPLSVDGEHVWRAPSLPTDGPDAEAVRLFLDRSDAHLPSRSDEDLNVVIEICRHLDGIPLAIELAAAQVAHLSVDDIARRLGDRFSLLTGGRRRVQRQQTLLAAVEWSHDLLGPGEKALLRRLAVFPSWFDIDAVEAVCADDLSGSAVRPLGALVAKSLVARDPGRSRYRLLETIRLYAEERLVAANEAEELRERHCQWVFDAIERIAADAGRTLDGLEALTLLEDDLRAGLQWCVARSDLARAARALNASGSFWWFTGKADEGLRWLEAVEPGVSASDRANLLGLKAGLLMGGSDPDAALRAAEAARLADPDDCSPQRLQADLITVLLLLAAPGSESRIDDLIRRASSVDDPYFLRQARDYKAHLLLVADPDAAVAEWADLLATTDPNRRGIADFFTLVDLGGGRHLIGDHDGTFAAADELDRRGFSIGRGWTSSVATYLRALGSAGIDDLPAAHRLVRILHDGASRYGGPLWIKDAAMACVAMLVAANDLAPAARILGAVRGTGPPMSIAPITFALHRHYNSRVRQLLGAPALELYAEARTSDPLSLTEEAIGVSTA